METKKQLFESEDFIKNSTLIGEVKIYLATGKYPASDTRYWFEYGKECYKRGIKPNWAIDYAKNYLIPPERHVAIEKVIHSAYMKCSEEDINDTNDDFDADITFLTPEIREEIRKQRDFGLEKLRGINIPEIDKAFKFYPGELTVLIGHANHGKSSFAKFMVLMAALGYDEKWAFFSNECGSNRDFFRRIAQTLLGETILDNHFISEVCFEAVMDWLEAHIIRLTPKQRKIERICELTESLIKSHGIKGVIIDTFANVEKNLSEKEHQAIEQTANFINDFVERQKICCLVVVHAMNSRRGQEGSDQPMPRIDSVAGGYAWERAAYNILTYHRPFFISDKDSPIACFSTLKIRNEGEVGERGIIVALEYNPDTYRFLVINASEQKTDHVDRVINEKNYPFYIEQSPAIKSTLKKLDTVANQQRQKLTIK
jgi:archaellum biogenesis ATPase FlaH